MNLRINALWYIKALFTVHTGCCSTFNHHMDSLQKVNLKEDFSDAVMARRPRSAEAWGILMSLNHKII